MTNKALRRELVNTQAKASYMLATLKRFASAMEQHSYPELQGIASDAFAIIAREKRKS